MGGSSFRFFQVLVRKSKKGVAPPFEEVSFVSAGSRIHSTIDQHLKAISYGFDGTHRDYDGLLR